MLSFRTIPTLRTASCLLAIAFGTMVVPRCNAQQGGSDSLFRIWKDNARHDTARLAALNSFLWAGFMYQDPDSALVLNQQRFVLAKAKGYRGPEAEAYNMSGYLHSIKGDHGKAIADYTDCLRIYDELGKKSGVGVALSGIGSIYYYQGDLVNAMKYYKQGLEVHEAIGNEPGIAFCLNNIGNVHADNKEPEKALACYERVLKIRKAKKDVRGIALALNNIGLIHADMALISAKAGNAELATTQRKVAIRELNESIHFCRQVDDLQGECGSLVNIASIYADEGVPEKVVEYNLLALPIAQEHGFLTEMREIRRALYKAYQTMGRYADALAMHEEFILIRDSIVREENQQEILRQRMQYDFDKKEAMAQAEQDKKDALAEQELRRQKMQRNGFMGGFALVALFAAVFFFQRNRISKEKQRSEELLLNILPEEVAEELKAKGSADAVQIDQVTVLFTDFKGFTAMSEILSPRDLVRDLNECFSAFDHITGKYGIEKIKTIGDAYMAAGGLPTPNTTHATDVIKAAFEMRDFIAEGKALKIAAGLPYFEIRIGVHTGPVVAGIVGVKKFSYDIWGDTVNTASRMESSGVVGQVNVSEATYVQVREQAGSLFHFTPRGKVQAKGKGEMEMFFVERHSAGPVASL